MDTSFFDDDLLLVQLAREVAMDHWELDQILQRYQISTEQWMRIKEDKYFNSVLASELVAWNAAMNTHERSKLKAASVIENWLPEAHTLLHARGESLAARVGLAQLLTKIAGMGAVAMDVQGGGGGERFVININLGREKELRIEKVINAEEVNSELEVIEEEQPVRAIPAGGGMAAYAASGGGVKQPDPFLNPTELVKKWSV